MLIGIDMLAVQASEGGNHEAGRYGRQLVDTILAREIADQFILYTHEDWPVAGVPASSRRVIRKQLPAVAAGGPARYRATLQRLVDGNPDGLDWLILLDPFSPHYGGIPPETPLGPLKIASVVHDLNALRGDDRGLTPLRRHEAIFAVSGATAAQCRGRLGSASSRVATLNVAADPGFAALDRAEPLGKTAGDELGRLGVSGPFLLHVASQHAAPANLAALIEIHTRLPIEHRHRHRLVIAGTVPDAAEIRAAYSRRGGTDGLILVDDVPEATLKVLYGRCSAYLAPGVADGSSLAVVEAMTAGAPVIAGRSGPEAEIVGDAGLLVDPLDPHEVAAELAELLSNTDLECDLRKRSLARSTAFGWDAVADSVLAVVTAGQTPAVASTATVPAAGVSRLRIDPSHNVRPRIAYFPSLDRTASGRPDLVEQIPSGWLDHFNVDFYFEADTAGLADGLPADFGGFDVRLFDRNDHLLGYHAVVHRVVDARYLDRASRRLTVRPGLVLLEDDAFLDSILLDPTTRTDRAPGSADPAPGDAPQPQNLRADFAIARVRDVLRTGSALVVRSPRHFDILHESLGEQAEAITLVPLDALPDQGTTPRRRAAARARLDLWAETVVIGQFVAPGTGFAACLGPQRFRAILKTAPNLVLLTFASDSVAGKDRLAREANRLGLGDRYLIAPAVETDQVDDVVALLDLAIHPSALPAGPSLNDLLRAGVPTITPGGSSPITLPQSLPARSLARTVRDLAIDPAARSILGQAGRDYVLGVADPTTAATLLVELIERCARDLPRSQGPPTPRSAGDLPLRMAHTPHYPRPASATTAAAHRRGDS